MDLESQRFLDAFALSVLALLRVSGTTLSVGVTTLSVGVIFWLFFDSRAPGMVREALPRSGYVDNAKGMDCR